MENKMLNVVIVDQNKRYRWYLFATGLVVRSNKITGVQKELKPFKHFGNYMININYKKYFLNRLVAKYFLNGLKEDYYIINIDGDRTNCHYKNLKYVKKRDMPKAVGFTNSIPVIVEGKEYPSIKSAAKALSITSDCISDYIRFKPKKSVLFGLDIRFACEDQL